MFSAQGKSACKALFGIMLLLCPRGAVSDGPPPSLELPARQSDPPGWRLTWNSQPGARYLLQRSRDLANWEEVATLTANGVSASLADSGAVIGNQVFWRVLRIQGGPDALAPVVFEIEARLTGNATAPLLDLRARAIDNGPVTRVDFLEGEVLLGAANPITADYWGILVALDPSQTAPRHFQARATDTAGNAGFSGIFTYTPEPPPSGFLPIGAGGQPSLSGLLGRRPDGSLLPFTYLPDNTMSGAPNAAAQLVFPEGGRLIDTNGQPMIEFRALQFRFGPNAALRIATPRTSQAAPRPLGLRSSGGSDPAMQDVLSLVLPEGQSGLLPLGPLSVQQLEELFNLPSGQGIPVKLFDRFPLRLVEGVIKDYGIEGAKWALDQLGLPLPNFTGDWVSGVFDYASGECGTFPLYGEIPLPELGETNAKLKTTKEKPLVLKLCPNGEISLRGPAALEFSNGARLTVAVTLDDPLYRLQLGAESVVLPVAGALALVLPDDPSVCLPPGATDAELDVAEACLRSFRRAYLRFAQTAVAGRPNDAPSLNQPEPPSAIDTAGAIADAWAASVFTPLATALPLQPMREMALHLGRSASGATDFKTAVEYLNQIVKLKASLDAYAQNALAGNDPALPGLRQDIDAALDEATAAAIARSTDPEAITSLECMRSALTTLVEIWELRQLLGNDNEAGLQSAIEELITAYYNKYVASLGIETGQFNHANNPVIAGMNRFTALEHAATVYSLLGEGAVLGMDFDQFPLIEETKRQVFGRAFQVAVDNLEEALTHGNSFGGMLGLAELLDLLANWELLDGGAVPGFPTIAGTENYAVQLGAVFEQELLLPREQSSLFSNAKRVRTLLEIVEQIPASATILFSAIERAFDELDQTLNTAVLTAPASGSVPALLDVLRAGAAYMRLQRQFTDLAATVDWEGPHLPAVVNRLGQICQNALLWSPLDDAVGLLLEEADLLEASAAANPAQAGELRLARKLYQAQTAALLARQHTVAIDLWNQTDTLRKANPEFFAADAFLPGDLKIEKIYGSLAYHRSERLLTGAFGGALRLPKINSFLTIQNSLINSRGEFDLNAHGQLSLPGGTNSTVVVTVEKKQPWHISWKRGDSLSISGKTKFTFNNGVFFEAGANIHDPLYFFEAAAGGLELDTAETLAALLPLSLTVDDLQNLARAGLWNEYFRLLARCLETGYRSNDEVPDPLPGSLPAFAGEAGADLYCALEAWSCLMLAEAERGNLAHYQSTYEKIGLLLGVIDSGFQDGLNGFETIFGQNAEFEIGYQLRRLRHTTLSYEKVSRALARVAQANLLGAQTELRPDRMLAYLNNAAVLWRAVVNKLSNNPVFLRDRDLTALVAKAGLDLLASYAVLDLEDGALLDLDEVTAFLENAANAFATSAGLNRPTSQINSALIATFSYDHARDKLRRYLDMEAELQLAGLNSSLSLPFIGALLDQMRDRSLEAIGFNPANSIFFPDTVADLVAQRGLAQLVEVAETRALSGLSALSLPAGFSPAAQSLHDRLRRRAQELPLSRWQARSGLVVSLAHINLLLEVIGQPPINSPAAFQELLRAFEQMARVTRGRFTDDELTLMRAASVQLGDASLRALYTQRLEFAAGTLATLAGRAWTEEDLSRARGVFEELLAIEDLRRRHAAVTLAADLHPLLLLPQTVDRFIAIGQAEGRGQPLAEVAALLGEAIGRETQDDVFRLMLMSERLKLLNAARAVASGYSQVIAQTDPNDRPADFHLPENLVIRRVFGSIFYNRTNAFLKGTFGGRLEFPNEKAFFEVNQASLDSQGGFSFQANTKFPLQPVENSTNVTITASLAVAGGPAGLTNLAGNGQMTLVLGGNTNNAAHTQTYNVSVSYDGTATNRPLRFTAAMDGVQNASSLRFSDDFVLFGGSLSGELSLASTGGFTLKSGGRAGFFARTNQLVEPVKKEDFWVFLDINSLGMRYQPNSIEALFGGGSLTLAEDFFKALEELPGGDLIPTDEPITIPVPFSFAVGYNFAEGRPIFSTGHSAAAGLQSFSLVSAAAQGPQPVRFDLPPLAFGIPGLQGSQLRLMTCQLEFFADRFPVLRQIEGSLGLPFPGSNAANTNLNRMSFMTLSGENWRVDGFPDAAAIGVSNDLRVVDLEAFDLDLLSGSLLSFTSTQLLSGELSTRFTVTGGVRGVFSADTLFDEANNGAFGFATIGGFSWNLTELPVFAINAVEFSGRLRLGGANGFALLGVDTNGIPDTNANSLATIRLTNLQNLFQLSPQTPFEVNLSGALGSADFFFFGLENARFVFDGLASSQNLEPAFSVQSIGFREGRQLALLGQSLLPFRPTAGSLAFLTPGLPLNRLFAPTNLLFTVSGEVNVSLSSPDSESPDVPRLYGAVQDVQISLPSGYGGPPHFSLNTFALTLENLSIGDLAGLSGGLAVGNLRDPANLYFAGTVGGGYNGVAVKAILAARLDGLIGLCLKANAGPAGIPLDGGTLGGILLTGAEGGVFLGNEFADPCDFTSYLQLNEDGLPPADANTPPNGAASSLRALSVRSRPAAPWSPTAERNPIPPPPTSLPVSRLKVVTWDKLAEMQGRHEEEKALRVQLARTSPKYLRALHSLSPNRPALAATEDPGGADVPCPTGDCPPPTINLLCQRHPSISEVASPANYNGAYRERVIFKFSSLPPEIVDEILAAGNIDLRGSAPEVAERFASETMFFINGLIPRPPAGLPANQAAVINLFLDNSLAAMRDVLQSAAQLALEAASGQGRTPLQAIYEAAYAGVPCVDITIQLKGTFSYLPISMALSATGGAVASTTGSAGILGSVNLFGIPVGTGEFFYSLTDTNGLPNPSLCGGMRVALGPLALGHLNATLGCDECVTGTLQALQTFVTGLSGDLLGQAQPILLAFIQQAAGDRLADVGSHPLPSYFGPPSSGALLTQAEQVAVLSALLNLPEMVKFLEANPQAITEFNRDALLALGRRALALALEIYNRSNPRLTMCGEVEPKLFGFSLTGGNTLLSARLYQDKTNIRGDLGFSPSYVFGNLPFLLLSSGYAANVVPALDEAVMGFSLGLPLINETSLNLLVTNPPAFAALQVDHLLENAIMTFGYELKPFGLKLADGEGRIVLPTLPDHPENPLRRSSRPNDYQNGLFVSPTFPNRDLVLKAALDSNVLALATWTGRDGDLERLFPPASPEAAALAGRELVRDYFPHGGFIGASKLLFPKPISDPPPFKQLNELFAENTDLFQRVSLAMEVFNTYILGTREVGQMAIYVPLPNPPGLFWSGTSGPQEFINAIASIDETTLLTQGLGSYPVEQFFMRGNVNAQVLGMPVGEGLLIADPAHGLFRLTAQVATNTWLHRFVQGGIEFEIKSAEYILETNPYQLPPGTTTEDLQPETRLLVVSNALAAALRPGATLAEQQAALQDAIARITDTLPKASLAASLNLDLPPEMSEFLRFNSGAGFFAFSPRFEPGYARPGYTNAILFPDPDPNQPGPYTLARRNGGMVAIGDFTFGFNLNHPDTNQHLLIDIPEMALGLTGSPDASLFPALNGRARVNEIAMPGAFTFNGGPTQSFQFRHGLLSFNTGAEVGQDYLAVEGAMTPLDLGPFLSVRPFPAEANPSNLLGGTLRVTRTSSGSTMTTSLRPAQVRVPMLGNMTGFIYGAKDLDLSLTPFTFSTVPGQEWKAALELNGALTIHSPLDPTGPVLFQAEPLTNRLNQPIPFLAQIEGSGLESFELRLTIPNGLRFTLFPGTDQESILQTGANSATCLFIGSDGRIYFDSGTRPLNLNQLAHVTGRIELGFEPVDRTPLLGASVPNAFTARLGGSHSQRINVANLNRQGGQLVIDARVNDAQNWSILPNRVVLGPNQSATLEARFIPLSAGAHSAILELANNSTNPMVQIPLSGAATTAPRMHVSVAAIDFGLTPLGVTRHEAVRISNLGDAALSITDIATAAPFGRDRSALSIPPGGSRDLVVSFAPESISGITGALNFKSNDPDAPAGQLALSGRGSNRFWYRQRRGTGLEQLWAVAMKADDRGLAAGRRGALPRAEAKGQMWTDRFLTEAPDLRAAVFLNISTGWVAGLQGRVYRTANGADSWARQTSAELNDLSFHWRAAAVRDPKAGLMAFAGESETRGRIVTETSPGNFNAGVVPSSAGPLSGIAFGTLLDGMAVGENATLLVTTDGGKTWQKLPVPKDVSPTARFRAVAVSEANAENYIVVGDDGLILRTLDHGATWTLRNSSARQNLYAVTRGNGVFYAAGDNGTLLRSPSTGLLWFIEDGQTSADFRGMTAFNSEVWAVSADGDIFHRRTTALSGPVAVIHAENLAFGEIGFGERVVREARIGNQGTKPLTARLISSDSRFKIIPEGPQDIPPGGEAAYAVQFEFAGGGGFGADLTFDTSDPTTEKLSLRTTATNRKPDYSRLAYALMPVQVNLGAVLSGTALEVTIPVENIGQARLNLHDVTVRHDSAATYEAGHKFEKGPFLDPGERGDLIVSVRAPAPGLYRAQLELLSDARNGVAVAELITPVAALPEVVVLDSTPDGAGLTVNGTPVTAPAAFTIVSGSPAPGQLRRGAQVNVLAEASRSAAGVPYVFQRWEPGTASNLTFTAGESAPRFTARYTRTLEAGRVTQPRTRIGQCEFNPPADVAFGPWVKISEATLILPWLGDGSGTPFEVRGGLFLSLTRAYGSLLSERLRLLVPTNAPALQRAELLELTPGSWNFDIEDGHFQLAALSPGLQVLNASAFPPSDFSLEIDLGANAPNRQALARFATLDELPLAPGLLAMGPSSIEFAAGLDPTNPAVRLALDGNLRALPNPAGGWTLNRNYELVIDPALTDLAPLTFTTRTQLADLLVARLHANAGSRIGPVFDGDSFRLVAEDLLLEFFRSGEFLTNSASISADGTFTFSSEFPAGLKAGPVRLVPHFDDEGVLSLVANPLQGVATVNLPQLFLYSETSPKLWDDNTVVLPGFSFDSREFTLRVPLPSMNVDGLPLDGASTMDADNYLEFKRTSSASTIKFRNEQDLHLGAMKASFTLSHDGSLSGQLSGRIGLEEPPPLHAVSDYISMSYNPAASPEFVFNRYFFGVGTRLQWGSGLPLGRACLLKFELDVPLEEQEVSDICFP